MFRNKLPIVVIVFLLIISVFSCKKDLRKISTSDWNPSITAPFVNSTIGINNLFIDDSNLVVQPDSSLIYIFMEDSVFRISVDTMLDITEDISNEHIFSLGELYMDEFGVSTNFTMLNILPFLDQEVQDTLLAYNGSVNFFPPFQLIDPASIETDAIEEYIQLTISDGKMYVDIYNRLPVRLVNIEFQVIDESSGAIITQVNIPELLSSQTHTDSTDISDITLGNQFTIIFNSLDCPGSFPDQVLIDLNQGIELGLQLSQLRVIKGQAKIIEQIITSETNIVDFSLDPEELYHIMFSGGKFTYMLNSELNVSVEVSIQLPTSKINNQIPSQEFELPAGGLVNHAWDISGMSTDLTTDTSQQYNHMPISVEIILLPTDYIVEFDSSDKVRGDFGLEELKLDYADGYLGQQTVNISKDTFAVNFDFLQRLKGELILEEPSITMNYVNSFGIPFRMATEIYGVNTETGIYQFLDNDSINIDSPVVPGEEISGQIIIDKTNSSIIEFISLRPDKIVYFGTGISNPDGRTINFLDSSSRLIGNAELKIPLLLSANHLNFTDTLSFLALAEGFPIRAGKMKLNCLNGFPFDMTMSLQLNDSISGIILDEIIFDDIQSAIVDENGKVSEKVLSEMTVEFDENFMENMKISNRILINIETSTFGNIPVVLCSNYEIRIALGLIATIDP